MRMPDPTDVAVEECPAHLQWIAMLLEPGMTDEMRAEARERALALAAALELRQSPKTDTLGGERFLTLLRDTHSYNSAAPEPQRFGHRHA